VASVGALSARLMVACDRAPDLDESDSVEDAAHPPTTIEVRDGTRDLLLTWVDDKGDFHVVSKPSQVPEGSRELVRVVVTTRREGTGSVLYVADLRKKKPDGTYPVRRMPRAEWDEVGASKRKTRLEALKPKAPTAKPVVPDGGGKSAAMRVEAIVYGAQWCKPCHDAARYLRTLGVNVVVKDIESSGSVRAELERKLARAKMPQGSSIPIIDVAGKLLVGFDPRALDHAVQEARRRQ
jgi:glutaredoxin